MTKSSKTTKVILYASHGVYSLYAATKENAMRIFNEHVGNMMPEVIEIAESKSYLYVSSNIVANICLEVLEKPVGEMLPASKEVNTKEIVSELSVIMVENNLNKASFKTSYTITEQLFEKLKEFSLIKKFIGKTKKEVKFLQYPDYLDIALDYKNIMKDNWKEGVEEYRIAQHIINFINNNLVNRHTQFDIVDMKEEYE